MKRNLFYFAWRELLRSANFRKNAAAKGVLIFIAVYFSGVALFTGFMLSRVLTEEYPGGQIEIFNSLIFLYVGFDLIIRVLMQNLPTFGFQPFLLVPLKRKRIARYMLNKSLLSFFNFLPLFIILPFTFSTAVGILETQALAAWLVSLVFMILINHFLAIYIKWRTSESNRFFYGFLAVAAGIGAISYFGVININVVFGRLFDMVILHPALVVLFPATAFLLYLLNCKYVLNRFYIDELSQKKKKSNIYNFSWLTRIGEYGNMLSLEVKMITRNRRPRNTVMMSVLFIFYGLLLYKDYKPGSPDFILVLGGMFMTGIFSMMYGQFFPAWHSRYYSLLMAQNVKMKQILQSAFFLMAATNIIFYLLSLGYMFISPKVLYIHFVVMLYNIGVNSFVIFALGLTSRKAIDLEQKAMFNYQGMGGSQWLISFPVLFGPLAIYGIVLFIFGDITAYVVLGVIGIAGIILHPRLIDYFAKQYIKRKHKMVSAYKNS